jgi:hypothetical protein
MNGRTLALTAVAPALWGSTSVGRAEAEAMGCTTVAVGDVSPQVRPGPFTVSRHSHGAP